MRDDIRSLFNKLLTHLELKKILLNSLLENENSASDLIKNRNDAEDELLKIIETESDLIDGINVEDYNISQIKDEIIRRFSFDFVKIFRNGYSTSEAEILNFKKEVLQQEDIIKKIVVLKKQNISVMDINQKDLELQISELNRMGKFRIFIPKDLQSS